MKLLLLGGTVFLGRALTDAALARGHRVTHVNRGKSRPDDARVETRHADRSDAQAFGAALAGDRWDAAIDTSGYLPQVVRISASALADRVARYHFVSTISVYASFDRGGFDEEAPVSSPPDPLPDTMQMELYGPLKSGCENVVREIFGARATIVRPGLIVGPHDPTDRFTYWPVRAARGGDVLAPGRPGRGVQFVDVRDLAEWMILLAENNVGGTFNATGPRTPLAMGEFLDACVAVARSNARLAWIPDDALVEAKAGPWKEIPLWLPESDPAMHGLMGASIERALAQGLAFRQVSETLRDTLAWARTRPASHEWKAGLTPSRERELLEAARTGSAPSTAPARPAG